jgi:hypothetical protein
MINKCIDYLEQNGYYGHVYDDINAAIAFKVAEELCVGFTDKEGNEVPDDVFDVVVGLIEGEL